ncbi:medium-chain acyl-CoA ligase ACSF2, mitochondrial-like [Glandiceps talaboti]
MSLDRVNSTAKPGDVVLVCADFNLPDIYWNINNGDSFAEPLQWSSNKSDRFFEILSEQNLLQFNTNNTCNSKVLHLICCNDVSLEVCLTEPAVNSDHSALECNISNSFDKGVTLLDRFVYNFKKADFEHLNTQLSLLPWGGILGPLNVDDSVETFYDLLIGAINDSIPKVNPCICLNFTTLMNRLAANIVVGHCVNRRVLGAVWTRFTSITAISKCMTTACRHHQKYTKSYAHTAGSAPLIGQTIGNIIDTTTEKYPDKTAVVFCRDGIERTYTEFKEGIDRLAAGLLAVRIRRGDRVGMWSPNRLEWVLTQYPTARIGAIQVNINPAHRPMELEYALKKAGCKTVISAQTFKTQDYWAMLCEICPELEKSHPGDIKSKRLPELKSIIMLGQGHFSGVYMFDDVMEAPSKEHFNEVEEIQDNLNFDDPINIQFTSGTTGNPKGVALTHHNVVNNAIASGRKMGYHTRDHVLNIPLPLYHSGGMILGSFSSMVFGATAVYPSPSFEPLAAIQAVQNYKCTSQYGTPTMFIDMLNHKDFDKYDMSSLSTGVMGASPCPIEVMKEVRTKMHMTGVAIAYWATETSSTTFQTDRSDPIDIRVSTVGKPIEHTEAKIIDPQSGNIVAVETPGELCTRGYTTMLGYWEDEGKTNEVIGKDRWFHTGDIGVKDENGYVRIVGRMKDMVIRGGENIYPVDVEQFLYTNPKIENVQVIGVPDSRMGEELCAWVKLKAGQRADEDEIKDFCRGQITHFKIPRYICFVDSFPLTVTGKVQKFIMREESIPMLGLDKQI